MKTVDLVCCGCEKTFTKPKKEYDRQRKNQKTEFYCTRQCFGLNVATKHLMSEKAIRWRSSDANREHLRKIRDIAQKRTDPFRVYMKVMKVCRSGRRKKVELTVDDLKNQWTSQEGRCAYSGMDMSHPRWIASDIFSTASVDRIDSAQGYVPGNIHFVLRVMNFAKNNASDERFRSFLRDLRDALPHAKGLDAEARPS